ncbi:MAG: peptide deformylase [candidate division TA06 bacterium 32_111]|uniref:Peptide deformylase n=2 Tax=Bacteria candidate phyla TaxID=1783234 RepID=A0A117M6R7_UNCT6|nr:MAG: peptide deformylase [candidate division TA06 bacterium 32_111]KUK87461.1 MAG: peptide deformylase [candidate division TA06 bacterium 34_109]HAF08202.1 peptide deformylase [candidate division WOR-3 bacterium]HCP16764.1 peptide deformylase [candidate division WOR-3 bacterium]
MKKIRKYPDPVLRIKSEEIKDFDRSLKNIIKTMKEGMLLEEGIGLAANQIGITKRIILIGDEKQLYIMINPVITYLSDDKEEMFEGCLSFEELTVNILRSKSLKVKYSDENGNQKEGSFEGLYARAIQHEVDHLNGILIIDYLEPEEKLNYNMKILENKEKK